MRALILAGLLTAAGTAAFAETTLTFEGLLLSRAQGDRVNLIEDHFTNAPFMTTDDLGTAVGAAFGLSYRTEIAGRGLHLRGIFAPGVTASATLENQQANTSTFQNNFDFASGDPNGFGVFCGCPLTADLMAERETTLGSVEANLDIAARGAFTFYGGLRALMLDDDLAVSMDYTPSNQGYGESRVFGYAENRLYGPQIGFSGQWPASVSGVSLQVFGSLGYFHNTAKYTARGQTLGIFGNRDTSDSNSRDFWTPGVEVGVSVKVDMRENTSLSLGYNALYLHEVADSAASLRPSQFSIFNGANAVLGTSDALFHGAKVEFKVLF
jgi:hypothetical protein